MAMTEMYRAARSLEAIENYASAARAPVADYRERDSPFSTEYIYSGEQEFWEKMFAGAIRWNQTVELYHFAISEWVGRIPGLFWTPNAEKIRQMASQAGSYKSNKWEALYPLGKSQKVMGGVGTLKFPPDFHGYRLFSLTAGLNASAGIPVLMAPEVWQYHKIREGRIVFKLSAKWQSMSQTTWVERFPSTRGIPKGFLVVEQPNRLQVYDSDDIAATRFHPCTVMEYSSGGATLYDFVYATADTGEPNHRRYIEEFFEQYKKDNDRYGRYLLAADIENPLWEAEFETPESLRRVEPNAKSQLELLEKRIQKNSFRGKNLDDIIRLLAENYRKEDLFVISSDIGIPSSKWHVGGSDAGAAADFLAECERREKIEELIDAIALEYPMAFM